MDYFLDPVIKGGLEFATKSPFFVVPLVSVTTVGATRASGSGLCNSK